MAIDCKECGEGYCPVCKDVCPKCGNKDIADKQTMDVRRAMRSHMDKKNSH